MINHLCIFYNFHSKIILRCLFCFFFFNFFSFQLLFSQTLHHQMISAQGTSVITENSLLIQQTIGQQSVVGTHANDMIIQQGFQQSFWFQYINSISQEIEISMYPNPFTEVINFQFSELIDEDLHIKVYDIMGRIVFFDKKASSGNLVAIHLPSLPDGEFLIHLSTSKINYFTKIIKKL